jgi:Domain of unknown function (DUF4388)/PilZ domain
MDEARRSVRVSTRILAAIEGIDAEPSPAMGNISATGAYFETTGDPGDIGAVHWLRIVSMDRTRSLRLLAHVARRVTLDDADGRRWGVAFEFMPESEETREKIGDFVVHALEAGDAPSIEPRLDAYAPPPTPHEEGPHPDVAIKKLTVRSFTLETSWRVLRGETVRADISAPGIARPISVRGRASRVSQVNEPGKGERFLIEVEVHEEVDGPVRRRSSTSFRAVRLDDAARLAAQPPPVAGGDSTRRGDKSAADDTLDDLLSALVLSPAAEQERRTPQQLSGQLGRVHLGALCSLFDMERISGELLLARGNERVTIFVRNGELVDVAPVPAGTTPRDALRGALRWTQGTFDFFVGKVDRENKINAGTTALLLDLAREDDEAER